MKRSRKPRITSERNTSSGVRWWWWWYARNSRSRTVYAGLTPSEALRILNRHRYHPVTEDETL